MHELGIVFHVIRAVENIGREQGLTDVASVTLELGQVSGVVPHELEREGMNINKLWLRRQTTKFNGVPYIVQKGAAACFTEEGMKQIKETLGYYKQNAKVLAETLDELGIWYTGGKSSPYLWLKCPNGMDSWTFFDYLLVELVEDS